RKEALLHPDLTVSVAGRAGLGLRAGLGTAAMAGVALFGGRNADFGLRPMRRLFERDFQVVAQVCAAINGRAAACAPAAEDVAEDVAEGIREVGVARARAGARARIDTRVAVTVVGGALVLVRENLVGFLRFLEVLFRLGVVRIAVRVVFHRELAVGPLQLVFPGIAIDAEHFVIVAFGHFLAVSKEPRATSENGERRGFSSPLSARCSPLA